MRSGQPVAEQVGHANDDDRPGRQRPARDAGHRRNDRHDPVGRTGHQVADVVLRDLLRPPWRDVLRRAPACPPPVRCLPYAPLITMGRWKWLEGLLGKDQAIDTMREDDFGLRSGRRRQGGVGLMFLLGPFLWTGCGQTSPPGEPTAVAVPAPGSATAAPLAGAVVVANTGAAVGDDSYVLNAASVTDDMLTISVSYGGGCRTHALTLVISESFIETSPVQLSSVLAHYANNDPCEAFLTHSYTFDFLSSGRDTGRPTDRARAGSCYSSTVFRMAVWSTISPCRSCARRTHFERRVMAGRAVCLPGERGQVHSPVPALDASRMHVRAALGAYLQALFRHRSGPRIPAPVTVG